MLPLRKQRQLSPHLSRKQSLRQLRLRFRQKLPHQRHLLQKHLQLKHPQRLRLKRRSLSRHRAREGMADPREGRSHSVPVRIPRQLRLLRKLLLRLRRKYLKWSFPLRSRSKAFSRSTTMKATRMISAASFTEITICPARMTLMFPAR